MNALYLHLVAFLITKYTTSYVNFELTLKQMGKKIEGFFKTTSRLSLCGNYSSALRTMYSSYTVLSTSSEVSAYVRRGEFNQTEFCFT